MVFYIDPVGLVAAWGIGRYLGNRSSKIGWAVLSWVCAFLGGLTATTFFRLIVSNGDVAQTALFIFASLIFVGVAAALGVWLPWPKRRKAGATSNQSEESNVAAGMDGVGGLLEKHATLELLDRKLKEANQLLAAIERNDAALASAGLTAINIIGRLSRLPAQEIKRRGTAPLRELERNKTTAAIKAAEATPGSNLEKQPLDHAVERLISSALLAKSVALDFEAQGVPEQQGLVYARNIAKALFGKIDEYIRKYAAGSGDEPAESPDTARTVDPPLVQTITPTPGVEAATQMAGPQKLLVAAAAITGASVGCTAFLLLTGVASLTPGESFAYYVGQFMGLALPILLLGSVAAALAAGIGRLIRGKAISVATPIGWGLLAAAGYTALIAIGVYAKRGMDTVQYQPPGCEFKVTFPRAPEIKPIPIGDLKFEQANVYTKDAVLRAECVPLASPEAASKAAIREWLENFAAQQALTVERIRVDRLSTGVFGYLTGSKMVSGKFAKYDVRVRTGRSSLLMLMAGSLASAFPPEEAESFFSSVR